MQRMKPGSVHHLSSVRVYDTVVDTTIDGSRRRLTDGRTLGSCRDVSNSSYTSEFIYTAAETAKIMLLRADHRLDRH